MNDSFFEDTEMLDNPCVASSSIIGTTDLFTKSSDITAVIFSPKLYLRKVSVAPTVK